VKQSQRLLRFARNDNARWKNFLKKIIIIFAGVIFLSGCAKVRHMDQLLTLKGLAEEQVSMGRHVEEQDQKFELMLKEAKVGTLDQYSNKRKISRTFGRPIYVRNVTQDNQELESWLYRYATEFFGAEKIYLYFDLEGNLVKSEYVEEKNGKIR